MTTISIEELGSRFAKLLEDGEPVMVMRDDKDVAVIYPVRNPEEIPLEVRRKRFIELTDKIGAQMPPDVTDEDIERDFAEHKKRSRGR
jgi:antitoxin (DNA-binding transcriptional repressor) of toxin-antitoxin stability system